MDDIAAKLSELLNSPDGMEQIKSLASSFLGTEQTESQSGEHFAPEPTNNGGFEMPDIDIGALMKLSSAFKNSGDDDRSRLLLALKPHLSEERRARVDQAVKILKLIALWPVISESGLLKNLF